MGHDENEVIIMKSITCCPKCKKMAEAKDYMNPMILGALDSILPQIYCRCGYRGLPISLSEKDYLEWIKAE
jgi:hypothetical protein